MYCICIVQSPLPVHQSGLRTWAHLCTSPPLFSFSFPHPLFFLLSLFSPPVDIRTFERTSLIERSSSRVQAMFEQRILHRKFPRENVQIQATLDRESIYIIEHRTEKEETLDVYTVILWPMGIEVMAAKGAHLTKEGTSKSMQPSVTYLASHSRPP